MATGALYEGQCYASNAAAADAYFTGALPAFTSGSTSYLSEYARVGGVWKINRFSIAANGTVTTLTQSSAPVPTFPTCDTVEKFVDGQTVGWGIALAMVCAWCIRNLRSAM